MRLDCAVPGLEQIRVEVGLFPPLLAVCFSGCLLFVTPFSIGFLDYMPSYVVLSIKDLLSDTASFFPFICLLVLVGPIVTFLSSG